MAAASTRAPEGIVRPMGGNGQRFMQRKTSVLWIALGIAAVCAADSQAYIHQVGRNMVDSQGKTVLWKGFGLGEWMNIENYFWGNLPGADVGSPGNPTWGHTAIRNKVTQMIGQAGADEFYRKWMANIVTEADVAQYAGWGVNSIRVSLNYHWLTTADGVYLEDGFKLLDNLIGWGGKYGVYIILALHAAPGGQGNELMADVTDGNPRLWTEPATYQPWTINLWKKIAERYAKEEWVGGYDIFDEPLPPDNSNTKALLPLYKKITAAIREVDKNHILIFEGIQWSQDFSGLETPWDGNMAYSFHHYDFDEPNSNNDAGYADWNALSAKSNTPLWNGETGEPDYGSDAKNNEWAKSTDTYCTSKGYGWSWWTTKKVGGNSNPYVIKPPANWSRIISAFSGGSISQAEAAAIMTELADNAATAKCTRNTGLITALGFCATCPPAAPTPTALGEADKAPGLSGPALRAFADAGGLKVSFVLAKAGKVRMDLLDIHGALRKTMVNAELKAGGHAIGVDRRVGGTDLPGGLYFGALRVDGAVGAVVPVIFTR